MEVPSASTSPGQKKQCVRTKNEGEGGAWRCSEDVGRSCLRPAEASACGPCSNASFFKADRRSFPISSTLGTCLCWKYICRALYTVGKGIRSTGKKLKAKESNHLWHGGLVACCSDLLALELGSDRLHCSRFSAQLPETSLGFAELGGQLGLRRTRLSGATVHRNDVRRIPSETSAASSLRSSAEASLDNLSKVSGCQNLFSIR